MKSLVAFLVVIFISQLACAGLSANIGYNNPPEAQFGLNLMYAWPDIAAELGFEYYKSGDDDKGRSASIFMGALNAKYFFTPGSFRPYAQFGTGLGFSTTFTSTQFGIGESFYGGCGFFIMGSGVYSYASYNLGTNNGFIQAGVGIDL